MSGFKQLEDQLLNSVATRPWLQQTAHPTSGASLGGTGRARPRPRSLAIAALITLVAVGAMFASSSNGPGLSLAAQAYAATASNGTVVHYTLMTRWRAPAGSGLAAVASQTQVWLMGSRRHAVGTLMLTDAHGHRIEIGHEEVVNGSRFQLFQGGTVWSGSLAGDPSSTACRMVTACGPELLDPVASLREMYQTGRLRSAGHTTIAGRAFDILIGTGPSPMTIIIDPHTFRPVEMTQPDGTTSVLDGYTRLPGTRQNIALLSMRSHPSARVVSIATP